MGLVRTGLVRMGLVRGGSIRRGVCRKRRRFVDRQRRRRRCSKSWRKRALLWTGHVLRLCTGTGIDSWLARVSTGLLGLPDGILVLRAVLGRHGLVMGSRGVMGWRRLVPWWRVVRRARIMAIAL